jgi:outer membrane protein assembly factor BamB
VLGAVVLAAGVAVALYAVQRRLARDVHGSSTVEYVPTAIAPAATPEALASPTFGGTPERLHVGRGDLRPPYRLDWVAGGASLLEFPPAIAFHRLYLADGSGNLMAFSTRTGARAWVVHEHRCVAASPAVNRLGRGTVYETFLGRRPCTKASTDGEVVAVATGTGRVRWRRHIGASETSPLLLRNRVYVGDWTGTVHCLRAGTGGTVWTFRTGGPVKGAIAADGRRLYVGSYDGHVYALDIRTGKLLWRAAGAKRLFRARGTFYSSPAVAYSRVYIGSTDSKVYSFGARTGRLRWSSSTGGYVYGSPAVWRGRVFVGSYDHWFYAFDAATGRRLWRFHANGPISGSATVVAGVVYFASFDGRSYALDARTGRHLWSYPDGRYTPVVTDGQRLYLVGYAKLYAFVPKR